jgi:hypothetical protein
MSVAIIRNAHGANTPNCTLRFLATLVFTLTLLTSSSYIGQEIQLDKIKLPPRFEISVYANNVRGARSMTLSPKGILFVGTREPGAAYAVLDHECAPIRDSVARN